MLFGYVIRVCCSPCCCSNSIYCGVESVKEKQYMFDGSLVNRQPKEELSSRSAMTMIVMLLGSVCSVIALACGRLDICTGELLLTFIAWLYGHVSHRNRR